MIESLKKSGIWQRASIILLRSISFTICILLVSSIFLLTTNTGLKVIASYISSTSTIPIEFKNIRGRLITSFSIEKIKINNGFSIHDVNGRWKNGKYFQLELHSDTISTNLESISKYVPYEIQKQIEEYAKADILRDLDLTLDLRLSEYPELLTTWTFLQTHYQAKTYIEHAQIHGSLFSHRTEEAPREIRFNIDHAIANPLVEANGAIWIAEEQLHVKIKKNTSWVGKRGYLHIHNPTINLYTDWFTEDATQKIQLVFSHPEHNAQLHILHNGSTKIDIKAQSKKFKSQTWSYDNASLTMESQVRGAHTQTKIDLLGKDIHYKKTHITDFSIAHYNDLSKDKIKKIQTEIHADTIDYNTKIIATQFVAHASGDDKKQIISTDMLQKTGTTHADITIERPLKNWQIILEKLSIADNYLLVRPENPKKISFESDNIQIASLKNETIATPVDINMRYFYDKKIDTEFTIDHFPLENLPPELLEVFIIPFDKLQGTIDGKIRLSTEENTKPTFAGNFNIQIEQARINSILPSLPLNSSLEITKGNIQGTLSSAGVHMNGLGVVNQGQCNIDIFTPWSQSIDNKMSILINGKNLVFRQNPKSVIKLDSKLHITQQDEQILTHGDVHIHDSLYHNNSWDIGTQLPPETIIISENENIFTEENEFNPFNIKITLGRNNQFHAFGFHGDLIGELIIKNLQPDNTLCEGNIQIINSHLLLFKKYLPLNQCMFSWFESPLNNPNLNLEILQKDSNIKNDSRGNQNYGIRVLGPVNQLEFEFFSNPKKMTEPEILSALLVQSKSPPPENSESMDKLLTDLNYHQYGGNDLQNVFSLLTALRKLLFFDQVDIDNYDTQNDNINGSNRLYDDLEITLTKLIDENFTLRVHFASNETRSSKVSFDAQLNDKMTLSSYMQNEGITGLEFYYSNSY